MSEDIKVKLFFILECEVQIRNMIFQNDYHALKMYVLAFPFRDFWKFGFLQSFFVEIEVSTIVTFFGSIQNKLSRLDLTFFQLFYVGLFKQSFPSRNWFYLAWKSCMNYAAWFIHYESSNRGMNNHKHLNNPDTFVIW